VSKNDARTEDREERVEVVPATRTRPQAFVAERDRSRAA
jgi:hypothetical protein